MADGLKKSAFIKDNTFYLPIGLSKAKEVDISCICSFKICSDLFYIMLRWRLITHGGIDGFSRIILYLRCHNNNKAETAFTEFSTAVNVYGLPS